MPRPTDHEDYRITLSVHDATREEYDALPVMEEHADRDPVCRWKRLRLGSLRITVFTPAPEAGERGA